MFSSLKAKGIYDKYIRIQELLGNMLSGEGNDAEWKPDTKGKKQRTLKWQLHEKCTVSHYLIIFKSNIITLL